MGETKPTVDGYSDTLLPGESAVDGLLREIAESPPQAPPSTAAAGMRWGAAGRYLIERRLGRGGMGTVYVALDTVLTRQVALKVLDRAGSDESSGHARLLREASLAARVEHERIARVYDIGEHDAFEFVAMEYVRGETLRQWMKKRPATPDEIVAVATRIAEGLAELHAHGVVHRDL